MSWASDQGIAQYTVRVGIGEAPVAGWADRAGRAIRVSVSELAQAGVVPAALAEFMPARRRFGVLPRPATMRPIGEVWRLGALLLGTDGRLFAAGHTTRAAERGRPGYQSQSREERRDLAAAALRGGYPLGTPVNFDAVPLRLDLGSGEASRSGSGADLPLGLYSGELRVRWRPGASLEGAPTLEAYLDERVSLLIDPPLGST